MSTTSLYLKDLAERVVFTAVEAAAGLLVIELSTGDVPTQAWWAVPLAAAAATLKGFLAKKIGRSESASTAPSV